MGTYSFHCYDGNIFNTNSLILPSLPITLRLPLTTLSDNEVILALPINAVSSQSTREYLH